MVRQSEPLGDPPGHLPPADAACWAELVRMAPPGTLIRADRWMVEIGACLLARWRAQGDPADGEVLVECLEKLCIMASGERVN